MKQLHVFDSSALIGFLNNRDPLVRLYRRAEHGRILLGFPTTVIHDANAVLPIGWDSWYALLNLPDVICLPLTEHVAVAISGGVGELAVRHAVFEAKGATGLVVTCRPDQYEGRGVPVVAL
ncbi:hypothetical protein AB0J90_16985 [Micromonospora sp. NPDC049523]|uniref:hypothetical protein n=1 Tax=Micromonospora sp. NPDC049523 TaxID=3155921 RepID=UPI00342068F0